MMKDLAFIRNMKRLKLHTRRNLIKNKNVCSVEVNEDEEICENEEIIFMEIKAQTSYDESNVEGEVDLEAKFMIFLQEIEKCRRRNKSLKE